MALAYASCGRCESGAVTAMTVGLPTPVGTTGPIGAARTAVMPQSETSVLMMTMVSERIDFDIELLV